MRLLFCCFALSGWVLFGQSGISGAAPVTLQNGTPECGGECVTVDIFVDVTGLSGTGGDAGLNGFVLAWDLDRGEVFASAFPGMTPISNWQFVHTDRSMVGITDRVILVGAVADMAAPNQSYHVATVVLCGSVGNVNFTFVPSESSLGSRVVAGDGPGPIAISGPGLFTTTITTPFSLNFGIGISSWRLNAPAYDLVPPSGIIDMRDLVKLTMCGLP
ncbi:MAG: hypothetical protein KDC35_16730 [Acidobacteria bacterium]|nr:hypothetical protein [Acidobacteriota bacterium]